MCTYALWSLAGLICDRTPRRNLIIGALIFWSAVLYDVTPVERRGARIMNSLGWLGGAIA